MNVKNLVKKATVAREYSELDIARMDYQEERPDYFDGETYEANGAELTDVFESEKVSKKVNLILADLLNYHYLMMMKKKKLALILLFGHQLKMVSLLLNHKIRCAI